MRIRKSLTTTALLVGLSAAANAELSMLHYYSSEGTSITNDLVGTADGVLCGTSITNTSMIVTTGASGQWVSTTNFPPCGMMLPMSVATNMSTNAWTISTWVTMKGLANYATDFAISDGTTSSFILGAPQSGRVSNGSYVTFQPEGATFTSDNSYIDIVGNTATVGELYNKVIVYDGATATIYLNGEEPRFTGGPSSVSIRGIDMALLPRMAVNAGSPWGDASINGTTYAFGIFDQALTADDVAELYALGKDAKVDQIGIIGETPFKFRSASPSGIGVANDVSLSVKVLNHTSTFASAQLYLDSISNATPVEASVSTLGTTTTVTSVAMTLEPLSVHTAYLIATGANGAVQTNSWSFTMGNRFGFVVTPDSVSSDYSFEPEVSVDVIDIADNVESVDLYIDGTVAKTGFSNGSITTSVSAVTGPLDAGSNVICMAVVNCQSGADPVTNTWTFVMGGGTGVTVWNSDAPDLGDFDISQTNAGASYSLNVGYSATQTDRHEWTYVATDRPAVGQGFTTPSGSTGFELTSVWLKNVPYDGDGGGAIPANTNKTFTVRITEPSKTNTVGFVKYSETLATVGGDFVNNTGQWVQFRLAKPVVLNANATYGFDVGTTSPYFNTAGIVGLEDTYEGGTAYRSGDNGVGTTAAEFGKQVDGVYEDRAFIVNLVESGEAFSVDSTSPIGSGINNPITLQAGITQLNGVLDKSNTKLLIDDQEVDTVISGMGPAYTLTAYPEDLLPLSVHTAACVLVSSSPAVSMTNSWIFTMADGFTFADQSPSGTLTTNEVGLSVQIINAADSYPEVTVLMDGSEVVSESSVSGVTTTVTVATSGILEEGTHEVLVIAQGLYDPAVTNSYSFYVKLPTTDTLWNINIAGNTAGQVNVANGVIAVAPPSASGSNQWNNVVGSNDSSNKTATNYYSNVTDSSGGNPIGFITYGSQFYGTADAAGVHNVNQSMFQGWVGANAPMNMTGVITGLNNSASYDIWLYSTWRWTENTVTYDIVEGFGDDVDAKKCTETRSYVVGTAANDYSTCVEGANYVVYKNVTPTVEGRIAFTGVCSDGVLSGLQIREHAGTGTLPSANILSTSPSGAQLENEVALEVVMVDYAGIVDTNSMVLLLDGSPVTPRESVQSGGTTTVSYVTSPLAGGEHTAGIVPVPGDSTNEWTFSVTSFSSIKTSPVGMIGTEATLQAVIIDGAESVVSAVMSLDGGVVSSVLDSSSAPTSTVTYAATGLTFGSHTAQVVISGDNGALTTNEWTFAVAYDTLAIDNADFDQSTKNCFEGFDNDGIYNVPGWQDLVAWNTAKDGGVEAYGAWWGCYEEYSAFLQNGLGMYITSDYEIQEGDEFVVSFMANTFNGGSCEWTVTLFYDDPTNVIGSAFVQAVTDTWTEYTTLAIAATNSSFGGKLGVLFESTGSNTAALDEVVVGINKKLTSAPDVGPLVSLLTVDGGLSISWADDGYAYTVLTNGDLVNGSWGEVTVDAVLEGDTYSVTNLIGTEDSLFYKLQYSE